MSFYGRFAGVGGDDDNGDDDDGRVGAGAPPSGSGGGKAREGGDARLQNAADQQETSENDDSTGGSGGGASSSGDQPQGTNGSSGGSEGPSIPNEGRGEEIEGPGGAAPPAQGVETRDDRIGEQAGDLEDEFEQQTGLPEDQIRIQREQQDGEEVLVAEPTRRGRENPQFQLTAVEQTVRDRTDGEVESVSVVEETDDGFRAEVTTESGQTETSLFAFDDEARRELQDQSSTPQTDAPSGTSGQSSRNVEGGDARLGVADRGLERQDSRGSQDGFEVPGYEREPTVGPAPADREQTGTSRVEIPDEDEVVDSLRDTTLPVPIYARDPTIGPAPAERQRTGTEQVTIQFPDEESLVEDARQASADVPQYERNPTVGAAPAERERVGTEEVSLDAPSETELVEDARDTSAEVPEYERDRAVGPAADREQTGSSEVSVQFPDEETVVEDTRDTEFTVTKYERDPTVGPAPAQRDPTSATSSQPLDQLPASGSDTAATLRNLLGSGGEAVEDAEDEDAGSENAPGPGPGPGPGGVAGAALAGLVAPEPVSSTGGALILGGLAVGAILADTGSQIAGDRDRDDAQREPAEPVSGSELDVVDPTPESEVEQPDQPIEEPVEFEVVEDTVREEEIETPDETGETSGELDTPTDSSDTDPSTIRTAEGVTVPQEQDPTERQEDSEESPTTIEREDLVDERPQEPEQDPPSTRERQRRADLDVFERQFPRREGQIIGRGGGVVPEVDSGVNERVNSLLGAQAPQSDAGAGGSGAGGDTGVPVVVGLGSNVGALNGIDVLLGSRPVTRADTDSRTDVTADVQSGAGANTQADALLQTFSRFGTQTPTQFGQGSGSGSGRGRRQRTRGNIGSGDDSPLSSSPGSGGGSGGRDDPLFAGWLNETVVDIATRGGGTTQEISDARAVEETSGAAAVLGEFATFEQVAGSPETQERIEDVQELLSGGSGGSGSIGGSDSSAGFEEFLGAGAGGSSDGGGSEDDDPLALESGLL